MKKSDSLFCPESLIKVKKGQLTYLNKLRRRLRTQIKDRTFGTALSPSFLKFLGTKDTLAPLKENKLHDFYWTKLIEECFHVAKLLRRSREEELFDFWSQSEYMQEFFKIYKKTDQSILKSSQKLLKSLQNQIMAFHSFHLAKRKKRLLSYRPVSELGEGKSRSPLIKRLLPLNICLLSQDRQKVEDYYPKVQRALFIIQVHSPLSFLAFCTFTHSILPLKQRGVVSYSSDELPGVSNINMYERDFVDLMDDLIHENGHHFLNCLLNLNTLIREDDEKIYYSPWRKSLRPIRGLYHAIFTFYQGFLLFKDLSRALVKKQLKLSPVEQKKVYTRCVEEFRMLEFCAPIIEHAYQNGKITEAGIKVMIPLYEDLKKSMTFIKSLPARKALERDLAAKRKLYHLDID